MKDYATDSVTLAVSISDRRHQADVKFIRAVSFKRAWEPIEGLLAKAPQNIWIRIEVIHSVQRKRRAQLERILHEMTRMNYWRQGVSFDADFKTALLEMEINGHEFFKPGKGHVVGKGRSESWIDYQQVTKYLRRRNGQLSFDIESSEYVWLFTTSGIFSDGEQIWVLNDTETAEKGVRRLENPKKELQSYLVTGEAFLTWQIKEDGKFIYGYYPGLQRI